MKTPKMTKALALAGIILGATQNVSAVGVYPEVAATTLGGFITWSGSCFYLYDAGDKTALGSDTNYDCTGYFWNTVGWGDDLLTLSGPTAVTAGSFGGLSLYGHTHQEAFEMGPEELFNVFDYAWINGITGQTIIGGDTATDPWY